MGIPTRPSMLAELAQRQHSLVELDQVLGFGVSRSTVSRWAREGRFTVVAPRVFGLSGVPRTWRARVMAACLSTGGLASHRTAAALHQLDGFRPGLIEISTDRWSRRRRETWRLHESKDLRASDHDIVDDVPCTSLVRTLIDLPAVCGMDHAGQALDHACRRDETVLVAAHQRFIEVARRGRNGTVKMRHLLNERLADPVREDSYFETKTLRLIDEAGLPRPVRQFKVIFADGSRAFLDLAWPDRMVCLECDSLAHHFGKRAFGKDRSRRRKLKLAGWDVYEYTYDDVTLRPDLVAREIRHALHR